jgi:hypothetical protein
MADLEECLTENESKEATAAPATALGSTTRRVTSAIDAMRETAAVG